MSFDDTFLLGGTLPDSEPGEDQRWSTWDAATPTERGPRRRFRAGAQWSSSTVQS